MTELIDSFITMNFPMIYFPHGLFFFAAGIGIMVQHRKKYPFRFAKDLWLMGTFALVHAASEWADLFIILQENNISPQALFLVNVIPYLLEAVSYMFLFIFGLRLLYPRLLKQTIFIPIGIFIIWCMIVAVMYIQNFDPEKTFIHAEVFYHYMLLFPSSILTSLGLYRLGKDKGKSKLPPKILSSVKALSVVFLFTAIFNGLIVNPGSFFPANLINSEEFFDIIHIPFQIIRGLIGTAMMLVTLKLLLEFNRETDRILAQAEEDAMLFSERERISQDLHDGVIQTLYATGMMLEGTVRQLDSESPIREQLNFCIKSLNTSLLDLRHYITGLKNEDISRKTLITLLENLISEIQTSYAIQVELSFHGDNLLRLTPNRQNHLYFVIKELLNNIEKHTNANRIHLILEEESTHLMLSIWDNGQDKGKPHEKFWVKQEEPSNQGFGMGLRNIRERITILRGKINYSYPTTGGTLVKLIIPKEVSMKNDNTLTFSR